LFAWDFLLALMERDAACYRSANGNQADSIAGNCGWHPNHTCAVEGVSCVELTLSPNAESSQKVTKTAKTANV